MLFVGDQSAKTSQLDLSKSIAEALEKSKQPEGYMSKYIAFWASTIWWIIKLALFCALIFFGGAMVGLNVCGYMLIGSLILFMIFHYFWGV
jgi:hypothetical protein